MASYFGLPPQAADERKQLGRLSLMSPAVTRLLEDLADDDSDSSSEGASSFDEEHLAGPDDKHKDPSGPSRQEEKDQGLETTVKPYSLSPNSHFHNVSPNRGSAHVSAAPARPGGGASARQKPPPMARFHSLRSILFQANIEDKMKTVAREDTQKEEAAADKWKVQHEDRQIRHPKSPEIETVGDDGIRARIRNKIRRVTSKDVPSMSQISEDDANVELDGCASTASSDNESGRYDSLNGDGDTASINDADIEELAQWVSRGNTAGSRQAKANALVPELNEDSDHESLELSDVNDLVRWVSRKSATQKEQDHTQHTGYSDASTESDTELNENSSDEEEDADDLVRWIAHRNGLRPGPVRPNLERNEVDSDVENQYESDVPELGRWFKRHDGTSSESAASSPTHDRADFLAEEEERGRPRSRASISPEQKQKNCLTEDDVDELVHWVSRRESKQQAPATTERDEQAAKLKREEEAKKKQLGMTVDEGSLSPSDLKEVIEYVRAISRGDTTALKPTDSGTASTPILGPSDDGVEEIRREEESKKKQLGMMVDEGSLSHSDMQELIAHVREYDIHDDPIRVV